MLDGGGVDHPTQVMFHPFPTPPPYPGPGLGLDAPGTEPHESILDLERAEYNDAVSRCEPNVLLSDVADTYCALSLLANRAKHRNV